MNCHSKLKTYNMKAIISQLVLALLFFTSCQNTKNFQEPEYRDLRNVKLIKVGVLQTTAGVDLVYYNPNDFNINLTEARGDVYIDNNYFGRFDLGEDVHVKKRSEFTIPVVFKLDNLGAIKNQRELYK